MQQNYLDQYNQIMKFQLAYTFDSAQVANRFLNDASSGTIEGVSAKFYRDSNTVKLTYSFNEGNGGFDSRSSDLDDLARNYQGTEVPIR
jgi:hypothetical protein